MTAKPKPSVIALIPARSGSKRVIGKNIRQLHGHPLLAYTIAAARDSGFFDGLLVSTDSEEYGAIAEYYGASVPFLRPPEISGDTSPDIDWIAFTLDRLRERGLEFDCFSILRPTSPFRKAQTIRRAWAQFCAEDGIDSLRAVEKCGQHPGKMWVIREGRMVPLLPLSPADRPWHSIQYQALPEVYVQNASLEIAWSRVVREQGVIAGRVVAPFLTEADEGLDVNTEADWWYAHYLLENKAAELPEIRQQAWQSER